MTEIRGIVAARDDRTGGQMPLREAEAKARSDAARFVARAVAETVGPGEASGMLFLSESTTREWKRRWDEETLEAARLGRPPRLYAPETVADIKRLMWVVGPCGSVDYVREQFPEMPRVVIEDIVRSFKRDLEDKRKAALLMCTWTKPGAVWAADWTEPDAPIDGGRYPKVLVVRDLASGDILLALPVERTSGQIAAFAMGCLFETHGAPLVLKTDNGPEFIEQDFVAFLKTHGVTHLLSPEYYPEYNGAVEAGNGALKARTMYHAARNGRLGFWTCDDVEAGRLQANETTRPRGAWGPSPEASWRSRERIGDEERRGFLDLVEKEKAERLAKEPDAGSLDAKEKKAMARRAIASALAKRGCLTIKRRGVSPAITHAISTDIT
jgi:transposase InsO family protein